MSVDPKTTPYRAEYAGKTYGFCSASCQSKFAAEPARYLADVAKPEEADAKTKTATDPVCGIPAHAEQDQRPPEIRHQHPDKATPTHSVSSATPPSMMLSTPKRRISEPVKNEGANMPIICHSITSAAEL